MYLPVRDIGVDATPDQILLTHGIGGGIDLVGRYLLRPNDVVLVDDPGYFQTFGHMRALGASVKGVPWTSTGPDIEQLETIVKTHHPRFMSLPRLFTTPPGLGSHSGPHSNCCNLRSVTIFTLLKMMFTVPYTRTPPLGLQAWTNSIVSFTSTESQKHYHHDYG